MNIFCNNTIRENVDSITAIVIGMGVHMLVCNIFVSLFDGNKLFFVKTSICTIGISLILMFSIPFLKIKKRDEIYSNPVFILIFTFVLYSSMQIVFNSMISKDLNILDSSNIIYSRIFVLTLYVVVSYLLVYIYIIEGLSILIFPIIAWNIIKGPSKSIEITEMFLRLLLALILTYPIVTSYAKNIDKDLIKTIIYNHDFIENGQSICTNPKVKGKILPVEYNHVLMLDEDAIKGNIKFKKEKCYID